MMKGKVLGLSLFDMGSVMSKKLENHKRYRKKILFLVILVVYMLGSFRFLLHQVRELSEQQCISRLQENTSHFCTILYRTMEDVQTHLNSLADVAETMVDDPQSLKLMLDSFEKYGALCRLEVLLPDNTLLVSGEENVSGILYFNKESFKGSYISGRMEDSFGEGKQIIRIAIPLDHDGETKGIFYGVVDLMLLAESLELSFYGGMADFYVIEQLHGNFLLDTRRQSLSDVNTLPTPEGIEENSESNVIQDLKIGKSGYSAFYSETLGEYMYVWYEAVGIKDWRGLITVPESAAFAFAGVTTQMMDIAMLGIMAGVLLYFIVSLVMELREIRRNQFVLHIQSLLLQAHQAEHYFMNAMQVVKDRYKGKMLFLIDLEDSANKIAVVGDSDHKKDLEDDLEKLLKELKKYAQNNNKGAMLQCGHDLARSCPETMTFLLKLRSNNLIFVPVFSKDGDILDIMGIIQVKQGRDAFRMLEELSFSFSMAMHDLKYIQKVEQAGIIDALTGTMNRASYQERMAMINKKKPNRLGCIYVDVDNLHIMNNLYGHDAGDKMLKFISDVLMEQFERENVFRIGGDEFVVLTDKLSQEELEKTMQISDERIKKIGYHVSSGAKWAEPPYNLEDIIKSAEEKMYEAKRSYHRLHPVEEKARSV